MLLNNFHQITCKIFASGCLCSKPSMITRSSSSSSSVTALYCQPIGNSRSIKNIASRSSSLLVRNKTKSSSSTPSTVLTTAPLLLPNTNDSPYHSFRLFSSSSSNNDDNKQKTSSSSSTATDIEPTSFKDKITYMWKNYGKLAIGTYFTIYVTTLGSIFFALDFDVFNAAAVGLDPAYAINKFCTLYQTITGSDTLPNYIQNNPRVGTFAIAWVMCKFTEPIRLGTTLAIVPSISRLFSGGIPSITTVKK